MIWSWVVSFRNILAFSKFSLYTCYALIIVNNNNFTIVFDLKFYLDEYILPKIAERDLRRFGNLTHTSSASGVDTVILLFCSQLGVEILQIRPLYQKCCRKNLKGNIAEKTNLKSCEKNDLLSSFAKETLYVAGNFKLLSYRKIAISLLAQETLCFCWKIWS